MSWTLFGGADIVARDSVSARSKVTSWLQVKITRTALFAHKFAEHGHEVLGRDKDIENGRVISDGKLPSS